MDRRPDQSGKTIGGWTIEFMNARDLNTLLDSLPEKAFGEEWSQEYNQFMDAMDSELMRLNGNLFVLERMTKFPWRVFTSASADQHFWFLTWLAYYDISVVMVWRLCVDTDPRSMTVQLLCKLIRQHLVPTLVDEFDNLVCDSGFESKLSGVSARITKLRNKRVAHVDSKMKFADDPEILKSMRVSVQELLELRTHLSGLHRVLCFGHGRSDHPLGYLSNVEKPRDWDPRPDIEVLLDRIANESHPMTAYREQNQEWDLICKALPDDVPIIEDYARRLDRFSKWL